MNTNFKVIGLTRLGIKPESTAQETDALTTRPSEVPPGPPFNGPELLWLIELNLTVSLTVKFLFKPFEIYYKFITDCALISI